MTSSLSNKTTEELIEICRTFSGEYVPALHPATSFATTYSDQFVAASAEIYRRFRSAEGRTAIAKLYVAFREANIRSCRGGAMDYERTKYLVKRRLETHLNR